MKVSTINMQHRAQGGSHALYLLLLMFAGCSSVENTFVISDPEKKLESGEIQLCGSKNQLTRADSKLIGKMSITCEGEGEIHVRLLDGREAFCHIGYVTSGAAQYFSFKFENGKCEPIT